MHTIEGVDAVEFAKQHVERGRDMARDQGYGNIITMLHIRQANDLPDIVVGLVGAPPPGAGMGEAINMVISITRAEPSSVTTIADGYFLPAEREPSSVTSDSLAERFTSGDVAVREAILVVAASSEVMVTVVQPYRWTPVDGWEWDEIIVADIQENT